MGEVTQMMFTSALFIFRGWFGGGPGVLWRSARRAPRAVFFVRRFVGFVGYMFQFSVVQSAHDLLCQVFLGLVCR